MRGLLPKDPPLISPANVSHPMLLGVRTLGVLTLLALGPYLLCPLYVAAMARRDTWKVYFLNICYRLYCCGTYEATIEEPPPLPPAPRRTNLQRQGMLRRVGTIKEDGTLVRRTNRPKRPNWNLDTPCSSKDVPGNARLYDRSPPGQEELRQIFDDPPYESPSLDRDPFGNPVRRSRSSSWERPLSTLINPQRMQSNRMSQAHFIVVPMDGGQPTEIFHGDFHPKRKSSEAAPVFSSME
jgi:hypothetical protein